MLKWYVNLPLCIDFYFSDIKQWSVRVLGKDSFWRQIIFFEDKSLTCVLLSQWKTLLTRKRSCWKEGMCFLYKIFFQPYLWVMITMILSLSSLAATLGQNHFFKDLIGHLICSAPDLASTRGPFIYYVITCRGEGGQKMPIFNYFQYLKHAYVGEGVQKS